MATRHTTLAFGPRYDENELAERVLECLCDENHKEASFLLSNYNVKDRDILNQFLNEKRR